MKILLFSNSCFSIYLFRKKLIKHFLNKKKSEAVNFLSTESDKNRRQLRMAYIIEAFKLGSYKFEGGKMPMLFIRINDPIKLFKEYNKRYKYRNGLVDAIHEKHKLNVEIIEHFLRSKMTDEERWNYIENYFLGQELHIEAKVKWK